MINFGCINFASSISANMDILGLMKNRRYISALYQQINSVRNCPRQNMTVSNCPVQNVPNAKRKRLAETCLNRKYKAGYMFTSCLIFVQTDVCPLLFGKQMSACCYL